MPRKSKNSFTAPSANCMGSMGNIESNLKDILMQVVLKCVERVPLGFILQTRSFSTLSCWCSVKANMEHSAMSIYYSRLKCSRSQMILIKQISGEIAGWNLLPT